MDTGSGPGRPALDGGQLIGEIAFGAGTQRDDHVKVAILVGSVLAAGVAGLLLRSRNRVYDRLAEQESPARV